MTRAYLLALAAARVAAQGGGGGGGGSGGSNQGLVWGTYGQVSERSARPRTRLLAHDTVSKKQNQNTVMLANN